MRDPLSESQPVDPGCVPEIPDILVHHARAAAYAGGGKKIFSKKKCAISSRRHHHHRRDPPTKITGHPPRRTKLPTVSLYFLCLLAMNTTPFLSSTTTTTTTTNATTNLQYCWGRRQRLGYLLSCVLLFFCNVAEAYLQSPATSNRRTSTPHHPPSFLSPRRSSSTTKIMMSAQDRCEGPRHVETVLFIECGFGNDSHGQDATKAAVRACRNAIEFNSIPSVSRLVPNGYDGLKLDVLLAVPAKYRDSLELTKVQDVFPYGSIRFQVQDGGMIAPSGIAIERLGDVNEDMVVVCCSVTVGY